MENLIYKTMLITPEMAQKILEKNTMNRRINKHTVYLYKEQMNKGLWRMNGEPLIFAMDGTLLDGQHRLMAVVACQKPQLFSCVYNVEKDSFKTIGQGKKRTAADVFSIEGIPDANKRSAMVKKAILIKNSVKTVFAGISGSSAPSAKQDISHIECLNLYLADRYNFDRYHSIGRAYYKQYNMLSEAEICATLYHLCVTLDYDEETVLRFFDSLYDKTSDVKVAVTLRKLLIKDITSRKSYSSPVKSQAIIRAWNNYITNNNKRHIIPISKDEPETFK